MVEFAGGVVVLNDDVEPVRLPKDAIVAILSLVPPDFMGGEALLGVGFH